MNFVKNTLNNISKNESGQGTLEFTAVAVILLAITFGMIDFSRAVYANSTIQAASQEAARAAIVNQSATDAAQARMVGLDADRVEIIVNNSSDAVQVTVSYEFTFITPIVGSLFGNVDGTLTLTGVSNMIS